MGQGRAGLRRKLEADHNTQSSDVTGRISERSKIAMGKQISLSTQVPHVTEE